MHMESGYTLTLNLLNNSNNATITEIRADRWLLLDDSSYKEESSPLLWDGIGIRGISVIFNNKPFLISKPKNEIDEESKKEFAEYVINTLGIEWQEYTLLKLHYNQSLAGILVNAISQALAQNNLFITDPAIETNIFVKNNQVYAESKLQEIKLKSPYGVNVCSIPGTVSALYQLTIEGFKLEHINTSNKFLSGFYLKQREIYLYDEIIESAKIEETLIDIVKKNNSAPGHAFLKDIGGLYKNPNYLNTFKQILAEENKHQNRSPQVIDISQNWEEFPPTIQLLIFSYLCVSDLLNISLLNKSINLLSKNNYLWEKMYVRHFAYNYKNICNKNFNTIHYYFQAFTDSYKSDYKKLTSFDKKMFLIIKDNDENAFISLKDNPKNIKPLSNFIKNFFKIKDAYNASWLHWIKAANNEKLLELLYLSIEDLFKNESGSLNAMIKNGKFLPLLHWAIALKRSPKTIESLLAKNQDDIYIDINDYTPFYFAALMGLDSIMELLLNNYKKEIYAITEYNKDIKNPVCIAAKYGHTKCMKLLLQHKASTEPTDWERGPMKYSPLYLAIANRQLESIKILIEEYNANTNRPFYIDYNIYVAPLQIKTWRNTSITPVYLAAAIGDIMILKFLLEHKGAINKYCSINISPLHVAILYDHINCVQLLANNGANVTMSAYVQNLVGTPLFLAAQYGHKTCIKILIDHGANVNQPIYLDKKIWGWLDEKTWNGAIKDQIKNIFYNQTKTIPNFDLNLGCQGFTPLFAAIKKNHAESVKILLEHGAEALKPFFDNQLPINIALDEKNNEIVAMLLYAIDHKKFHYENYLSQYDFYKSRASILIELDVLYKKINAALEMPFSLCFFKNQNLAKYACAEALWMWLVYRQQPSPEKGYQFELDGINIIYKKILKLDLSKKEIQADEELILNIELDIKPNL